MALAVMAFILIPYTIFFYEEDDTALLVRTCVCEILLSLS